MLRLRRTKAGMLARRCAQTFTSFVVLESRGKEIYTYIYIYIYIYTYKRGPWHGRFGRTNVGTLAKCCVHTHAVGGGGREGGNGLGGGGRVGGWWGVRGVCGGEGRRQPGS